MTTNKPPFPLADLVADRPLLRMLDDGNLKRVQKAWGLPQVTTENLIRHDLAGVFGFIAAHRLRLATELR